MIGRPEYTVRFFVPSPRRSAGKSSSSTRPEEAERRGVRATARDGNDSMAIAIGLGLGLSLSFRSSRIGVLTPDPLEIMQHRHLKGIKGITAELMTVHPRIID